MEGDEMSEHMWSDAFDLHSHSTNSDGEHPVERVAELMATEGVKHWSLTDHDTIAGWEEAALAAQQFGLKFIPGVEITCEPSLPVSDVEMERWGRDRAPTSWHLLAYFPSSLVNDEQRQAFAQWLAPLGESRGPRMAKMVELAHHHGMDIDLQAVLDRADGSVGRPHLADELIAQGYAENRQDAFDQWLGDGRPLAIVRSKPSIREAAKAVHECGGIVSLAHPIYYGVPINQLTASCQEDGVDAIECFHRSHPDSYRHELMMSARTLGLGLTAGSDFHGLSYEQTPGHMPVPLVDMPYSLTQ
jgi:predicted metal-dependent phosphoesterase TrpH